MLGRRNRTVSTAELPTQIDGLPVFRAADPYVLSNDTEIARLQASSDASFVRICKFGLFGFRTSRRWFGHIRDIIDCAEEEYADLNDDCGLSTPEHNWGFVPIDQSIKDKIRSGVTKRREAYFDHKLLPKGYLLGCEVERLTIITEFDRDLAEASPGFAPPEEYEALRSKMASHVGKNIDTGKLFTHSDLSPEQCARAVGQSSSDVKTYLFDIEPVVIPTKHYPLNR